MFDKQTIICYSYKKKRGNEMKDDLTKRQKDILDYIKKFHAENKYPPSIRQICKALDLNSPATVHVHINNLIKKGLLKRSPSSNHAIELLVPNEYENLNKSILEVPFLGKVTAGNPIEAIEIPNEYFSLPAYLVPKRKEVFTLEVNGDSMINIGIHDGDIVIVERQTTAKNGDLVIAMNDNNEVTLKRFFKENDYFRLQPENDYMEPIILKNVTILGKAIGLYRKF